MKYTDYIKGRHVVIGDNLIQAFLRRFNRKIDRGLVKQQKALAQIYQPTDLEENLINVGIFGDTFLITKKQEGRCVSQVTSNNFQRADEIVLGKDRGVVVSLYDYVVIDWIIYVIVEKEDSKVKLHPVFIRSDGDHPYIKSFMNY